eukprot:TRINITY_DN7979_c0_g1_i1.p1 TRINITY_DN7979_c0_g1~~TRINITY_DN7979_c0_g1_i1.p1  ORF type:complete len:335 (+),score=111.34 TRINITY_DN7979_c0_g1_i1:227-1231(+)
MSSEDDRFDGIFMSVIQQKQGIDGFFETIYGFLRRRTDFFKDQKQAEKVITSTCKKQFELFKEQQKVIQEKEQQKKIREEQRKQKEPGNEKQEPLKKPETKLQEIKEIKEQPQKEQKLEEKSQPEKILEESKKSDEVKKPDEKKNPDENKKEDDDKTPPPLGNGGKTEKYIWTQTLDELQVYIPIEKNITKKDLFIDIQPKSLVLKINQKEFMKGEWFEQIVAEDSCWTLEDSFIQDYKGKYIHLEIMKWKNQWHWWECVLKGDTKINTQKIQPESSNLSDLDGETRGTVEKMMFDMKQKQMGQPGSDELLKRDQLKDFMKSHPEMDFSKCKFN